MEVENTFGDSNNDFAMKLSADQEDTIFGRPETVGITVEENADQGVMSEDIESSGLDPLSSLNQVISDTPAAPPENMTVDQFDPLSATTITFIEDSDDDEDNLMG